MTVIRVLYRKQVYVQSVLLGSVSLVGIVFCGGVFAVFGFHLRLDYICGVQLWVAFWLQIICTCSNKSHSQLVQSFLWNQLYKLV